MTFSCVDNFLLFEPNSIPNTNKFHERIAFYMYFSHGMKIRIFCFLYLYNMRAGNTPVNTHSHRMEVNGNIHFLFIVKYNNNGRCRLRRICNFSGDFFFQRKKIELRFLCRKSLKGFEKIPNKSKWYLHFFL